MLALAQTPAAQNRLRTVGTPLQNGSVTDAKKAHNVHARNYRKYSFIPHETLLERALCGIERLFGKWTKIIFSACIIDMAGNDWVHDGGLFAIAIQ